MSVDPFVLKPSEYVRDINVLKHYIEQTALYISKMSGNTYEYCLDYVKRQVKEGGHFALKKRRVMYLERNEFGDREKKVGLFIDYLGDVVRNQYLVAPNFTIYLNPKQKQSWLTGIIEGNIKQRSIKKKEMFAAEARGDVLGQDIADTAQSTKKILNNSLSGASLSKSSPLENKTTHSTLTSTCRLTSGYGNANNERFLSGHRHYWHPTIVRNNIISIIQNSDYALIESVMTKYGLVYPSVEDTLECILRSTMRYSRSKVEDQRIAALVSTLTPIERAAFVYTGDLYHIRKHNDLFTRNFISSLAKHDVELCDENEPYINPPEDVEVLASLICVDELKELIVKNNLKAAKGKELLKTDKAQLFKSIVKNIETTVDAYSDFIRAFLVTTNVPPSIATLPSMVRSSVLVSDTDSSIFTVQDWVNWHQGRVGFDAKCYAVTNTMVFLSSRTVKHILAIMSVNSGIEESRIHQMAMKNEYTFDVLVPTQIAKHYFGGISCQEGQVYSEMKSEIKGVHLKSSNVSKGVITRAKKLMDDTVLRIMREEKIRIFDVLKHVADIEREIIDSIRKGDAEFYKKGSIKDASGYTLKEAAPPYQQYLFWNEIFAPKYGVSPPPPYAVLKASVDLDTPVKFNAWVDSIEDLEFKERILNWSSRTGRRYLGTQIQIPAAILTSKGLPKELEDVVGLRRIVLDTMKSFYIYLEAIGCYKQNDNITWLASDYY